MGSCASVTLWPILFRDSREGGSWDRESERFPVLSDSHIEYWQETMNEPADRRHEEFLKRYLQAQPSIRAYVLSIVRDFHVTETSFRKWRCRLEKYDRYGQRPPLRRLGLGVAYHKCIDSLRARKPRVCCPTILPTAWLRMPRCYPKTRPRRRKVLAGCVAKLTEAVRGIVRLRFEENLDTQRNRPAGGKSLAAVSKMLTRARAFLIRCTERSLAVGGN